MKLKVEVGLTVYLLYTLTSTSSLGSSRFTIWRRQEWAPPYWKTKTLGTRMPRVGCLWPFQANYKLCSLLWFFLGTDVSISNRQNTKDVLENVGWNLHVEYFIVQ